MRPLSVYLPLLFLGCVGCHRSSSPPPADTQVQVEKLARALGLDASALAETPDPPSPPGDLAADIAGFTTLATCMSQHATNDPLVADALGSLGYDTFLKDVCRTLEAAHAKSRAPCALIDASGLRTECETMLAVTTHAPDDCPLRAPGAPWLGREPTCLALASGDAHLCAGELRDRRGRCEAIAQRDDARCRSLGAGSQACVRDVARWRSSVSPSSGGGSPPKVAARFALQVSPPGDAGRVAVDLRALAERGVVLVIEPAGEAVCQVGLPRELGGAPIATSPEMGPRIAFTLARARDGAARLRHLEIESPGNATLVLPPLRLEGKATMTPAGKRGDAITLRVEGKVEATPRAYEVEIELETFIEDVIDTTSPKTAHGP